MLITVDCANRTGERVAMRSMFEARKRVFVDLLKWDIPVLDGRYEIDQFDDDHAIYVILTDLHHQHRASARLLPSLRPGILSELYPHLSDEPLPTGGGVYKITRFCLCPDMRAVERRRYRDTLVVALARYALEHGISTYTGIADLAWLRQILRFGWKARLLGKPQYQGRSTLGALRIEVDATTLEKLAAAGIHEIGAELLPIEQAA